MPTCAIYVRLSVFRAGQPDIAPETQRRACAAYAEAKGWTVIKIYEDLDVSGGSLERPQLDKLRREWRRYDHVVFHKLDRLSRSLTDFLTLHQESVNSGVALASVNEGLDMSTPMGRFVTQVLVAFGEMERETIRARVLAGKETARSMGRWNGGPAPFGFKIVDAMLEVEPTEATAIREIMRRRQAGDSWLSVSRWLMLAFPGRKWDARTIRRILQRELLRGTILTPGEFELAQDLAAPQERKDWTPRQNRLLSGLLRCQCGATMAYFKGHRGRPIYRCNQNRCERRALVYVDDIERHIEETFLQLFGDKPEMRVVIEADERAEQLAVLKGSLQALDADLTALEPEALVEAASRKRELLTGIAELQSGAMHGARFEPTGKTLGQVWAEAEVHTRRELLRKHIGTFQVEHTGHSLFTPDRLSIIRDEQTVDELLGL